MLDLPTLRLHQATTPAARSRGPVGYAIGDCTRFRAGNAEFLSLISLCLENLSADGTTGQVTYSLTNSPQRGGGFSPTVEVATSVDGSVVNTDVYDPLFQGEQQTVTVDVSNLSAGDHQACVEVANRSEIEF